MLYLIAYDVGDPRRLRRVARFLERQAVRCQKSVFLFDGDGPAVLRVMDQVAALLDLSHDCVQAWRLGKGERARGLARGSSSSVHPACVILQQDHPYFLEDRQPCTPE